VPGSETGPWTQLPTADYTLLKERLTAAEVEVEQGRALSRRWEARSKLAQEQVGRLVAYIKSISDAANNTESDIRILLRELHLD